MIKQIVDAVRSVIGEATPSNPVHLHVPLFRGNEEKYTADCIAKNQVTHGEYIERFEAMLCQWTGTKYAVATCSGTSAYQTLVQCHPKLIEKDEISIPTLNFVAAANAITMAKKRVRFEDMRPDIEISLLGFNNYSGAIATDAAQALGSGKPQSPSVYSFNGNKIITTGGGGAIVTDGEEYAHKLRHFISQSRIPHQWKVEHDAISYNYRMPNINAALGCAQLEQLPYILKAKRALANEYMKAFEGIEGVKVWKEPVAGQSNYWLVSLILDNPKNQEPLLQALWDAGYQARMLPTPLHLLESYKDCPHSNLLASVDLWKRVICLPSSPHLGIKYA